MMYNTIIIYTSQKMHANNVAFPLIGLFWWGDLNYFRIDVFGCTDVFRWKPPVDTIEYAYQKIRKKMMIQLYTYGLT
jgi:hypothetical protein